MLNLDGVLPALQRLADRLPVACKVNQLPVGQANELQGQAFFLEFRYHRWVLLIGRLDTPQPAYTCALQRYPRPEYSSQSSSGLSHSMPSEIWDTILSLHANELQNIQKEKPPAAIRPAHLQEIPDAHYPVLAAAIRQRMQAWSPDLLHVEPRLRTDPDGSLCAEARRQWWPQLAPELDQLNEHHLKMDPQRLGLPISKDGAGLDAIDFYARYPKAHGKLYLGPLTFSADGLQAGLTMRHSLALELSDFTHGARLPQPDGPRPGAFCEFLWMEKQAGEWTLRDHLPLELVPPPALLETSEKARIQSELGDWGQVLAVTVDEEQAVEARVLTPGDERRVIAAHTLYFRRLLRDQELIFKEPTLWVFSRQLTGSAIIAAYQS